MIVRELVKLLLDTDMDAEVVVSVDIDTEATNAEKVEAQEDGTILIAG